MHLSSAMSHTRNPLEGSREPADAMSRQIREPPRPLPAPRVPPSERKAKPRLSKPSLEPVIEGDQRLLRDNPIWLPGDTIEVAKKPSLPELSKRRGEYFEGAFASRDADDLGDRVRNASIVMAEVKTNVIVRRPCYPSPSLRVHDEYTFVSELSEHIALRYHRPASSVVVMLQHGACILFSGTCDPAYTMTVSALACYVQTATNKRNVALLQRHMEQALGIPATRGCLRFVPVAEECAGWRGKTVAGEIADAAEQSQAGVEHRDVIKPPRRKSSKSYRDVKSRTAAGESAFVAQPELRSTWAEEARTSKEVVKDEGGGGKDVPKIMKRRKSFIQALFPRSASTREADNRRAGSRG
ncbi:hypothetical protein ACJZ2D_002448 [Fusarium nematophilum]